MMIHTLTLYFLSINYEAWPMPWEMGDGFMVGVHPPLQSILNPGFTGGVLSNHPCLLVRGPSVFKYLRDRSKDFSNFLHEVSAP